MESIAGTVVRPYLVHFNPIRHLYADLDASKAFGFGAVVYHVKNDASDMELLRSDYLRYDNAAADCSKAPSGSAAMVNVDSQTSTKDSYPKSNIEPIMFLSRRLTPAEQKYWPTELEVAGLV
jgi:RNase H-like domain found in reverse transcriptase